MRVRKVKSLGIRGIIWRNKGLENLFGWNVDSMLGIFISIVYVLINLIFIIILFYR